MTHCVMVVRFSPTTIFFKNFVKSTVFTKNRVICHICGKPISRKKLEVITLCTYGYENEAQYGKIKDLLSHRKKFVK